MFLCLPKLRGYKEERHAGSILVFYFCQYLREAENDSCFFSISALLGLGFLCHSEDRKTELLSRDPYYEILDKSLLFLTYIKEIQCICLRVLLKHQR